MSPEHLLLLIVGSAGIGLNVMMWLQLREMRRESRQFWTATGGTLIKIWRLVDPEGAAQLDREMNR
jgi:hypothetical protein